MAAWAYQTNIKGPLGPVGPPGPDGPPGPAGPPLILSDTAPPAPLPGTMWLETDTGNLFAWWVDPDSSAWVQVNVAVPVPPSFTGVINVRDLGVTGSDDDTDALQGILDDYKGQHILIPEGTTVTTKCLCFDGHTYDGSKLTVHGVLKLYPNPTSSLVNAYGAPVWTAILVRNCDGVQIDIPGWLDCNGANMDPASASQHGMVLAGATNFRSDIFRAKEAKTGDCIYVTRQLFNTVSNRSARLSFGELYCVNAVNGGRNALTLADCDGGKLASLTSLNVGGITASARMPGGFCIEPNVADMLVNDFTVGSAYVLHQGTGGITVHHPSRNIRIESFVSVNDVAPTLAGSVGGSGITQAPVDCGLFASGYSENLYARGTCRYTNAYGTGVIMGRHLNADVAFLVEHVNNGARLGADETAVPFSMDSCKIDITVRDTCRFGITEGRVKNSQLIYRLQGGPTAGFYTSFYGILMNTYTVGDENKGNRKELHADYSAAWTRLRRHDPAKLLDDSAGTNTFTGNIEPGYNETSLFGGVTDNIEEMRHDLRGITYNRPAAPTLGWWLPGQVIDLTAGGRIICSVAGAPGTWAQDVQTPGVQIITTDAAFNLTPAVSPYHTIVTVPLAAARAVTLVVAAAKAGSTFRVTRTAASTGAFALNVGAGPLKALSTGQWCDVVWNGTAWTLSAYGAL